MKAKIFTSGSNSLGSTRTAPRRRGAGPVAAAVGACFGCRVEVLEGRLLLSAAGGKEARHLFTGHLSSPAATTWYDQQVAALGTLKDSNSALPLYQFQTKAGQTSPLQTAAPDPAGLTPSQLETYYNFTGLTFGSTPADGRGQTIALVDAYNDPNIATDLATFDAAYHLAAPPSFLKVSQTGSTTSLPPNAAADPINGSWATEESLDVEWAHALAPGANIMLVECNSASDSDLYAGVAYAAAASGVSAVSMSYGLSEEYYTQSQLQTIDATFKTPSGHQGVTFLASSGDDGAYTDGGPLAVSFPASSSRVLAVGGTTILTNSSGTPTGETAWSGSGGGVSVLESQTAAQKGAVGSYTGRAVPDVSFDADPNSGVNVCDSFDFGSSTPFAVFGGTSFSSPAWGAIIAITNQGRVAAGKTTLDGSLQTIPSLYTAYTNGSYSSVFKDVTSGDNGYYSATVGFDQVTGLGTPSVKNLVQELVSNTFVSTPPAIGSFTINPAVENAGTSITLSAANVTDTSGSVTGVNFYRVSGSTSTLFGAGTLNAQGAWTRVVSTTGEVAGTYTYSAIATNNAKQNSPTVTATNKVVVNQATPTIATFAATPNPVVTGSKVTLTASGVADTTSTISSVTFYLQSSGGTQTLVGSGVNQGSGKWTLVAATTGLAAPGNYTYVAIATAASGLASAPKTAAITVLVGAPLTVVVNTVADQTDPKGSKTVSLRDAFAVADSGVGPVTIDFDSTVFAKAQVITLTGSTLALTSTKTSTVINGPTAGVTISGKGAVEVLDIAAAVTATLSNLTITKGASGGNGGGVNNSGIATFSHVTISASSAANGGGIENSGKLTLVSSVITGNTAGGGAGIYNSGTLSLTQTTVSNNTAAYGGGAINNTGTVTVTSSTLSGNTAGGGAGLYNYTGGQATVTQSTISKNTSTYNGGGVFNAGTITIATSTISGNTGANGGGLYNYYASKTTITQSTLSGNSANYDGGALGNSGTLTLTNSTISGNSAGNRSGAIEAAYAGSVTIKDSTIARNTAYYYGGVYSSSGGTVTVANSIIAGNVGTATGITGVDFAGAVTSSGHNLIGQTDGSSGWIASDLKGTHAKPLNPVLSLLGNYGGPTQTLLPLSGSPALGAGSVSLIPTGVTTDQRGLARVVGGKVDIGAVETPKETPFSGSPAVFGLIQAENFDLGGPGAAYYNPQNINRGGVYRPTEGVGITPIPSADGGGYALGYSNPGEYLNYTVSVAATGTYTLNFRVASLPVGGTFHLNIDGKNVTGELSVPSTGDWNVYKTVSKTGVSITAGTHVLQLVIDSAGSAGVAGNFDWIQAVKT